MHITPFKNRRIDTSKPVSVYRNIHKKCYSVKQGGVVVAHATCLGLSRCTMHVNESGRQRVIESGRKNVHAYISGYLSRRQTTGLSQVFYNPRRNATFVDMFNGPVYTASHVWLSENGLVFARKANACSDLLCTKVPA